MPSANTGAINLRSTAVRVGFRLHAVTAARYKAFSFVCAQPEVIPPSAIPVTVAHCASAVHPNALELGNTHAHAESIHAKQDRDAHP